MSGFTQENRYIAISDFSLGQDVFLATSLEGSEYISDLYEFQVTVISENLEVAADDVVGKTGSVTIKNDYNRVFHGYVSSFTYGEIQSSNVREYRLTLVPWLWFLSKTNNHKIFQNLSAQDIISSIFDELGFADYEFRTQSGGTSPREYCVQHNESNLNFVSRLLEEEGIAYFFQHEAGLHKLILVDQKNAYEEFAETNLEYSNGDSPDEQITSWEHLYNYKKGQWSFADYDYTQPTQSLYSNIQTTSQFADNSKFEHYEYPGMFDFTKGNDLVKIRLESEEAEINTVIGTSDCTTFYAGGKFKVDKHDNSNEKGEYIVTSLFHRAFDTTYFAGESGDTGYSNNFVCIPSDVHFRPAPIHKKPVMRGPQSAIVTGPSGEEIYTDELGRIKVQFYWDRDGQNDENTTCFIRVMQSWSGMQWGTSFIPRIGHEVIVDFIDGDPDRPIVTGSVYNGRNGIPFDSKTKSGIRTRSTKEGTAANCNELIFDDNKDAEQIFIHAEKNMDTEVENNETLTVDNDRTKHIKHDENSNIDNDRVKRVGNNQRETIVKNKTIEVGGNHSETISKNSSVEINENSTLTVAKNISIDIGKDHSEAIGNMMTINVTKDLKETVGGKYTESVSKEYALEAKKIQLVAKDEISLKVGSASLLMKKNGDITINGKKINVKGSGDIILKGSKIKEN